METIQQSISDLKSAFEPVKTAVQERQSATVSASQMPEDKLYDLREAACAIVLPVRDDCSDKLKDLYAAAPPEPDQACDW